MGRFGQRIAVRFRGGPGRRHRVRDRRGLFTYFDRKALVNPKGLVDLVKKDQVQVPPDQHGLFGGDRPVAAAQLEKALKPETEIPALHAALCLHGRLLGPIFMTTGRMRA
jgi:hypothetical protein